MVVFVKFPSPNKKKYDVRTGSACSFVASIGVSSDIATVCCSM